MANMPAIIITLHDVIRTEKEPEGKHLKVIMLYKISVAVHLDQLIIGTDALLAGPLIKQLQNLFLLISSGILGQGRKAYDPLAGVPRIAHPPKCAGRPDFTDPVVQADLAYRGVRIAVQCQLSKAVHTQKSL